MKNEFVKSESKKITRADAKKYHEKYLKDCENRNEPKDQTLKSLKVDAPAVRKILDQPGCKEIRFYLGQSDEKQNILTGTTLILVGVDGNNNNMLDNGEIYDNCIPCPPSSNCPSTDF